MSNPDQQAERDAEVRTWVRYAREDLRLAEAFTHDPDRDTDPFGLEEVNPAYAPYIVPRQACSLAEQAAEKAIKAILLYRGIDFLARQHIRRGHDLDYLCTLIPDPASWSITREPLASSLDLARLTLWAVAARYPDAGPEPEAVDAAEALATAHEVVDSVVDDLQRNGFALTPLQ